MKTITAPLFVAAVLLLGATITSRAAEAETASAQPARPTIAIGMSAEQVQAMIGQPKRVKKLKKEEVQAEVWFYTFRKADGVRQVASTTRDIPFVDPITGVLRMIPEPVYTLENVYLTETTELLMVDGLLTSFKRYRTKQQDYN